MAGPDRGKNRTGAGADGGQGRGQSGQSDTTTPSTPPHKNPVPPGFTPWKPGQSGNPGGRPKGLSLLSEIRACFDKKELMGRALPGGKNAREAMAEAICLHVIRGKPGYLKELLDRLYGRVPVRVETKNADGPDGVAIPMHILDAMLEAGLKAAGEDTGPEA